MVGTERLLIDLLVLNLKLPKEFSIASLFNRHMGICRICTKGYT